MLIPSDILKGLLAIKGLSAEDVESLRETLHKIALRGISISSRNFRAELPNATVAPALHALYTRHYRFNESPDELVEAVAMDMEAMEQLEKGEHEAFIGRLKDLLTVEPLWESFKVRRLGEEHDKAYVRAKVITDARPVFPDDVDQAPDSFIVVHHLQIHFLRTSDAGGAYIIGMTDEDLQDLSKVIDRALGKASSLKKALAGIEESTK